MKNFLKVPVCGLILAAAIGAANAQQGGPTMNQSGQGMMRGQNNDQVMPMPGLHQRWGNMMPWYNNRMGPGMMSGRGWGSHMMGPGMMMGSMMGPEMMIVMLDSNDDGKLSLEEFQAVHARMFKYFDKDGDGQLTEEEIGKRWGWSDSDDD